MTEQIKIDFEKTIKTSTFSESDAELKRGFLNKFIAKSGECSRRQADKLVKGGSVTVNGTLELNPAYQVLESDDVRFDGRRVNLIQSSKTILLNKPIIEFVVI